MEIAATVNPVTYIMEALRSLILQDLRWETIGGESEPRER
jgi:ABC-2 type transport system permease protein